MTREEFSVIAKGMKAVYANPTFIADKDAFDVWYALLSDLDYALVSQATQDYMKSTSKIPTPADIRNRAEELTRGDELTETEAWALVSKALRNGIYHAQEEFEKLPPLIQRAVGSYEQLTIWASDNEYKESVASSNFMRAYKTLCERNKRERTISGGLLINGKTDERRIGCD